MSNILDRIIPGRAAKRRAKAQADLAAKQAAAEEAAAELTAQLAARKKAASLQKRRDNAAAKKEAEKNGTGITAKPSTKRTDPPLVG